MKSISRNLFALFANQSSWQMSGSFNVFQILPHYGILHCYSEEFAYSECITKVKAIARNYKGRLT